MKKILLSILLCLMPSISFATVYHVDQTGRAANLAACAGADPGNGSRCSMTQGNGASAGDTVYLYDDGGAITTQLAPSNSGSSGNVITYVKASGETPVITVAGDRGFSISGNKDYIKIDGITFTDCASFGQIANGSDYNEIKNCVFSTAGYTNLNKGIYVWTAGGTACTNNWIHNNTFGRSIVDPTGCNDEGGSLWIGVKEYGNGEVNNTVENNVFYAGGHHLLWLQGKLNVIRNNVFHNEGFYTVAGGCSWGASYRDSEYGNRCIEMWDGGSNTRMDNVLEGNRLGHSAFAPDGGMDGNIALGSPGNIFRYNKSYYSETFGLYFKQGTSASVGKNNRVYNNTIYYNGQDSGVYPKEWTGWDFDLNWRYGVGCSSSACTGNELKNNIIYDNYTADIATFAWAPGCTSSQVTDDNNWKTADGDPVFDDTDTTDPTSTTSPALNLTSASPVINGGTYLTTVHADDSGSGVTLYLTDATYFQAGSEPTCGSTIKTFSSGSCLSNIEADWICVGNVSNCVQITNISYTASPNWVALSSSISRNDGNYVWLYKKSDGNFVLYDTAPDYGASEYSENAPTISNPIPSGTQVCTGPTQSVTLGVSTNEASTCIYSPVDDDFLDMSNYNSGVTFTNTGGTSHSGVTTLASNCSYIFYATCMDTSGVSNGASGTQIYFNINECTPVVEQGQVIIPGAGAVKTVAPSTPGSGVFRIQ